MLKRKTALIFVFLASILYLAHAVIPHHHHQDHICLGLAHSMHHTSAPGSEKEKNETNNNSTGENECVVDHGIILPSKQLKPDSYFQVLSFHLQNFHGLFLSIRENGAITYDFSGICISPEQFSSFITGCLFSKTFGLRAPPAYFIV